MLAYKAGFLLLQATVDVEGVLLDTLVVESGETTLQPDADYVTGFDNDGYAVITEDRRREAGGVF